MVYEGRRCDSGRRVGMKSEKVMGRKKMCVRRARGVDECWLDRIKIGFGVEAK